MKVEEPVEMWRERARSLVGSGMAANAWCEENGVKRAAMFRWLERFRDEEPEVLGGWEAAHAGDGRRNWFEAVRRTNSGIAPAAPRACWPAPSAAPEFVEVELEPAPPHKRPSGAVAVDLRTMTALVGPGADEGAR